MPDLAITHQRSADAARRGFEKPTALVAAFVLAVGGVVVGQMLVVPVAVAAPSVGVADTGGWKRIGGTTGVHIGATTSDSSVVVPFTPVDADTLYFASYNDGGTVGYLTTDGVAPVDGAHQVAIGWGQNVDELTGNPLSTIAIDADAKGVRGERTAYFWGWNTTNDVSTAENGGVVVPAGTFPIVRWHEGDTEGEFILAPNVNYPGFQNLNDYRYWSGGEVIQQTGEIFLGGGECAGLNAAYAMMVYDPASYAYNYSGRISPATAGDNIFGTGNSCGGNGYVSSDFALDADGNAYLQVVSTQAAPSQNGVGVNDIAQNNFMILDSKTSGNDGLINGTAGTITAAWEDYLNTQFHAQCLPNFKWADRTTLSDISPAYACSSRILPLVAPAAMLAV